MALPDAVRARVEPEVGAVRRSAPVGGGCIANATRVEAETGTYFLKWADGDVGRSFEVEGAGLRALRAVGAPLVVPTPRLAADADGEAPGLLLLDWVETAAPDGRYWRRFGEALAALHRRSAEDASGIGDASGAEREGDGARRYGFDHANVIGRLPQANAWHEDWPAFFRTQRLAPQFDRARRAGRWDPAWDAAADRLLARLPDLLPAHPPASLLHGDLWSGNALATADGRAALIDPAVYRGHREADLALTQLFGGFDAAFYDAYRAAWPLAPGYDERAALYNLYHLVNHLNHFGRSYAAGVARTLRRFG